MSEQAIQLRQPGVMSLSAGSVPTAEIASRIKLIHDVQKNVMKLDVHYGVIPGTDKPTLYKAGSEVLLTTFQISVIPKVEDLSTPDEIRYRVRAEGVHQQSGILIGVGIGEASTNEEKYRWRNAVCKQEYDATPEHMRRIKYKKFWNKQARLYEYGESQQVRTNPADLANTVLKIAKKRAQVDMCLTSLSASDIFTQDVEDMDPAFVASMYEDRQNEQPNGKPQAQPEKPAYSDAQFNANFPKWEAAIQSGIKAASAVITTVSSKYTLSDAQKQKINSVRIEKPVAQEDVV